MSSLDRFRRLLPILLPSILALAFSPLRADEVDDYINRQMIRQHIPGLALAVLDHGKIVKLGAYGSANLETSTPVTPETAFQLASVTKQFTAAAVLLLVQDGTLDLDDSIHSYLDGIPLAWAGITLRQALTHTSGIPDYLRSPQANSRDDTTPEKIIQQMISVQPSQPPQSSPAAPLLFTPGTAYDYSNTNYLLLAMIIRRVTGKPYDAFLAERVFRPLGMSATRRDDPAEVILHRASGYVWSGDRWQNGPFLNPSLWNNGDGGILSTVLDLARWDAALSSDSLLTASTKRDMWTPATLANGDLSDYGLGWGLVHVRGHRLAEDNGGRPGTATNFARYLDDGITVLLLMNSGAEMGRISRGVARHHIPALGWLPDSTSGTGPLAAGSGRNPALADTLVLSAYTGYYEFRNNFLLTVHREGGRLVENFPGRTGGEWIPGSGSTFYSEDLPVRMRFERNASGTVTHLIWTSDEEEIRAARIGPLAHDLAPSPDPDRAFTREVESALKAFTLGGRAVEALDRVTPEARRDFSGGVRSLIGITSLSYLSTEDVSGRGIERHGAPVQRILYCRFHRGESATHSGASDDPSVLVYLTADRQITDIDVVPY